MKKKRAGKKKDLSKNTLLLSQRGWEELLTFKEFVDEALQRDGHPRPSSLAVAASIAMAHACASVDGAAFARNAKSVEAGIIEGFSQCLMSALKEILPDIQFVLEVDLETRRLSLSANQEYGSFDLPAFSGDRTKIHVRQ